MPAGWGRLLSASPRGATSSRPWWSPTTTYAGPSGPLERHAGDPRFVAAQVDASSAEAVAALAREHRVTHVLNAVDPRFVMPIFDGAFAAGADYLDMAMSLSQPHPDSPYEQTGVMLGDEQFAQGDGVGGRGPAGAGRHRRSSRACPTCSPATPRTSCSARSTRSGSGTAPTSRSAGYDFAPTFSIWTTIEECLNPPVVWEKDRGWFTTAPFSEPEVFDFPEGIGPVECVNVEHEEVLLIPRWVDAKRVTFKYGLGDEFITVLSVLHKIGLDSTEKVRVGGVEVSPRDVVAACLPGPGHPRRQDDRQDLRRDLGDAGARTARRARCTSTTWSTTSGRWRSTARRRWSGRPRSTRSSRWSCWRPGVDGRRACSARRRSTPVPFLDLLTAYGSPWGMREMNGTPAAAGS